MKYLKNYLGFFAFLIVLLIIPFKVNADTTYVVKVTSNPSNIMDALATVSVDKNITTIGQLKQKLASDYNLDSENYIFLNSNYQKVSDTTIIGDGTFMFNGPIDGEQFTILYAMPVDNTEKKITLKTVPPTNEDMFRSLVETNYELFDGLSYHSCNNDFTVCTFKHMGIDHFAAYNNVKIKYEYDKNIQKVAQALVNTELLNNTEFVATDTELLHYMNYGGSLADYTTSFKNQLSNKNFKFEMDQRGGAFEPFQTGAIGFYKFLYNDTLYAVKDFVSITAPHIIYVPTNTTDVKKAIENRLNDIFGDNLHLSVETSDKTINALLAEFGEEPINGGEEKYYILTITNENSPNCGQEFWFKAVKDSSKINNKVSFKSSDLITNVSVSTNSDIPLDTLIKVSKLSSGDDYDRIISALNISDGEVFDINLNSKAQNKTIKKLDNGKFLVSIPIPEKYEGKTLIIYYVDENNNIEEHEVTIKDGYATFETNHFSIYTLAPIANETTTDKVLNNPATGDSIITYLSILGLSIISLTGTIIYTKKKKLFN